MARRRSSQPSVRVYRGPLWKYVHPAKYLKAEARKAWRQMSPSKVLARAFNVKEIKGAFRTQTTHVTAASRKADYERSQKKAAAAAKSAAKKTAAKRADPYAVARGIPAANRAAAAKQAKAAQPAKKAVAVRKKNGQFDGSRSMSDRDREAWQRAVGGAVDPALLPRTPRRKPAGR